MKTRRKFKRRMVRRPLPDDITQDHNFQGRREKYRRTVRRPTPDGPATHRQTFQRSSNGEFLGALKYERRTVRRLMPDGPAIKADCPVSLPPND